MFFRGIYPLKMNVYSKIIQFRSDSKALEPNAPADSSIASYYSLIPARINQIFTYRVNTA